ncbi:hypothetical protein MMC14_004035 [Varicellaria rhodocarpa]|nr:hypothetical protein [Varicellaria rhodocarpa]
MRKSSLSGQYRCWVHVQKTRISTISSTRKGAYHVDQNTEFRSLNLVKEEDICGDLEIGPRQYDTVKPRHINGDPILSPKSVRVPTGFAPIHSRFDPIFLRDCCSCKRCVDPSTRQKLFETAEIPLDIHPEEFRITKKETVVIKWKNDISRFENHDSTFPMAFLATQKNPQMRMEVVRNYVNPVLWDRQQMESENLTVNYLEYLESDAVFHKALTHLEMYGMFYLSDVPSNPKMIGLIANRIGPLRNTFYGPTWDVRSVPSAKNIAYTSGHLGFHMDLLYMQNPPGLQILHCMKASAKGGESLFTDAFRALGLMQEHHPAISKVFEMFPVTYQYKNDGQYYQQIRATAESFYIGETSDRRDKWALRGVNWSPPFQAPFEDYIGSEMLKDSDNSRLRMYLLGAKLFKSIVEADEAVFQTKMEEGTCVVFNNRRILHARAAFRGEEGERWLRGAYVDTDSFRSRLRVLNEDVVAEQKPHEETDRLGTVY